MNRSTNNNNHNNNNIMLIVICAIMAVAILWMFSIQANASKTSIYEAQIASNDIQIQQIEEIKKQLHITAETLRVNENINNGFDVILSEKWIECDKIQSNLTIENIELQGKIDEERVRQSKRRYVGNFKLTHYCPCATCNGSYGNKTALGTTLTPYNTIAVDPRVIPLGSKVEIQGKTYIAEDTGGAIKGNRIDVCVSSHSEAYAKGVLRNVPVYIVN